jgi:bilirubin oxidase
MKHLALFLLVIPGLINAEPVPGGSLEPSAVTKYVAPLVIPPAMPRTTKITSPMTPNIDYYEIAVRQFQQQILPAPLPATTVWGYGSVNHPGTFNYPSFTIEAKVNRPVRVKWINDLKDAQGNFLPHLLPVDQTLHWANPPGPTDHTTTNPAPYLGPVPMVVHVHGAHVGQESDGYAEAWWLPDAANIPEGYSTVGSKFDQFDLSNTQPGTAVFQYPNDQNATTLWYHDHSLGMTRLNVYAGPAGFYLLRGGPTDAVTGTLPGPAPALGDPAGTKYYEIPIALQDRSFNDDGSLFYPSSRAFFDGYAGPYVPDSDIAPIWNPEFFGNMMVVNGKTWPYLNVEPRRYRFRFLNGCNSRFVILKMASDPLAERPVTPVLKFWQIGAEGGFLPAPVQLDQLLISPAERADVIVDFTGLPAGTTVYLINEGPDEPFGGGAVGEDFAAADPETTGQVMKFIVTKKSKKGRDPSTPPAQLVLPVIAPLGAATTVRQVSLNELDSATTCVNEETMQPVPCDTPGAVPAGPRVAMLGTVHWMDGVPMGMPMMWADMITENPQVGDTEIWEIYNFTMDAHPIHLHQVMFQVVNREPMPGEMGADSVFRAPELWETGYKDTVIAYPGEITRVKARFDLPGLFVWHCHIVEHEDNEMMRPFFVGPLTL